MNKWIAGCLLGTSLLTFLSVGCGIVSGGSGEKHTGAVTVRNNYDNYLEFIRPNGELFEMRFTPGGLQPKIQKGDVLADVVYTDVKDHWELFVKAVLTSEHADPPAADKVLYESGNMTIGYCTTNGACSSTYSSGTAFYLWKDGGYRAKPEPKK